MSRRRHHRLHTQLAELKLLPSIATTFVFQRQVGRIASAVSDAMDASDGELCVTGEIRCYVGSI